MNWVAIRPALVSVVQETTGLTQAGAVVWKGSPDAAGFRPAVTADLSITGVQTIGCDEERRKFNPTTQKQDVTRSGSRKVTMTVRFYTQDGTDSGIATTYADWLRVRAYRPSVKALLIPLNLTISDVGPTQTLDNVKIQNRVVSVAVVEVSLNATENDTDTSTGAGDWIQSASIANATDANGRSLLVDDAGNPLTVDIEVST